MNKQTSDRVSSTAARYIEFQPSDFQIAYRDHPDTIHGICEDIRSLAASCMSQDETVGLREDTFITRLQRERDDLDDRLGKLVNYLSTGAPGATPRHKQMLDEQNRLMSELLAVLDERLCDLQIMARSEPPAELSADDGA